MDKKTKLTKAQKRALGKMLSGKWYSAYDLKESLATLDALAAKGCVESGYHDGYRFFPRSAILYRKLQTRMCNG